MSPWTQIIVIVCCIAVLLGMFAAMLLIRMGDLADAADSKAHQRYSQVLALAFDSKASTDLELQDEIRSIVEEMRSLVKEVSDLVSDAGLTLDVHEALERFDRLEARTRPPVQH